MDKYDLYQNEQEGMRDIPYSPDVSIDIAIRTNRFTHRFPDTQVTPEDVAHEMELTKQMVTPIRVGDANQD